MRNTKMILKDNNVKKKNLKFTQLVHLMNAMNFLRIEIIKKI
jgi:hypothetical protein